MATYKDPDLRDRLAAEYVLGTMRGRARSRFESLMRYDPGLRRRVEEWDERFATLDSTAPDIAPPPGLWARIARRIRAAPTWSGWWTSLAWWRGWAIASTACLIALAVLVGIAPEARPPMSMLTVMHDQGGQPALVVSWPPMDRIREPHVRIKVVQAHPVMNAGTAWEMWMLPAAGGRPVSLGLIGIDRDQVLRIDPAVARRMSEAWGLAMSVEPAGGSPTGAPSGPVIFRGRCVKLL